MLVSFNFVLVLVVVYLNFLFNYTQCDVKKCAHI